MHKTIISDTSCLIILANIGELELLHRTYGQITTTIEIAEEFGNALPSWIEIKAASDKLKQRILTLQIDNGEASAIALAIELGNSILILDDYKARKVAEKLGIEITGTIGVIIKAKLKGLINSVKPLIEKINQTNFRLSEAIITKALDEAGE